jgi:hypothetical protein
MKKNMYLPRGYTYDKPIAIATAVAVCPDGKLLNVSSNHDSVNGVPHVSQLDGRGASSKV